ncbi:unnamed protein product [Mytilus coruscus]|uniref:DUF4371 domain-containing protein n=1 Tax=Mytilus coruscus TaxID=42192 RepID=A0A6J8AYD4_MYTCO|nr:unnamed protein product [Mytilus coruscus]
MKSYVMSVNFRFLVHKSSKKKSDPTNSDPYYFSGESLNDSDRTQLLFDIKMSSSKIVFPAIDGRRYSSNYKEKVKRNREILFRIIDTIVVLGQQNIPLRGHNWNKEKKKIEDGNFSRFLQWKANDVPILKSHLENAPYNAQYTSPDIQNELISSCGLQIKNTILKKVKEAKWFSIMADESTDVGTKEQMALCIRYVDRTATVFEDFIGFINGNGRRRVNCNSNS